MKHFSDHRYIRVVVQATSQDSRRLRGGPPGSDGPSELDEDALMASVISAAWSHDATAHEEEDPLREIESLLDAL